MENFILFFQIPDEICDKLVDYHKNNEYDKNNSKYGWDVKTKESVDCTCYQRSNHPVIPVSYTHLTLPKILPV